MRKRLSAFFAFVITHTPTALRLMQVPASAILARQALDLERSGEIPPPPFAPDHDLHGLSLAESFDRGELLVKVNPRAPQAMAIARYYETVKLFSRCDWVIVRADESTGLFFTSDHPSAILRNENDIHAIRVFPVSPNLAILIRTRTGATGDSRHPATSVSDPNRQLVREINAQIVRTAENLVFYPRQAEWIYRFVKKNSKFRLEIQKAGPDRFLRFREEVAKTDQADWLG